MNPILQFLLIIFWFVVILVPLVVIHELGHLLAARLFGVKIQEFGVGMPLVRRTFFKRWKGIIWSFYWPLLGGFVRIWGDSDALDHAFEDSKKDPVRAKENYKISRYQELILNRELRFFLEDNNLEYTPEWAEFEKSNYKLNSPTKTKSDLQEETKNSNFEILLNQLYTLIEWEMDLALKKKNTFFSKNWIQQAIIILAGVTFNLTTALVIFWFVFSVFSISGAFLSLDEIKTVGNNAEITNQSSEILVGVQKGSLADKAGIEGGSKITNIAGIKSEDITSLDQFKKILNDNKNQKITVNYKTTNNETRTTEVFLEPKNNGEVLLGVNLYRQVDFKAKNWASGVIMAFDKTGEVFTLTFRSLGETLKALSPFATDREALRYVGGPIAVGSISTSVFQSGGVVGILNLMAVISIGLAIMNLLPIPALDGGRLIILSLNRLIGKRSHQLEGIVIGVTFWILIGLGLVIAFSDVQGIVTGRFNF